MTDWTALLGLKTYLVTLDGWPRVIPVAAATPEGAAAKARGASFATTGNRKWLTAATEVVLADA